MSLWRLEGNRIIFRHLSKDFFWEMPKGFSMPSDELLSLVEFVLLRPFGEKIDVKTKENVKKNKIALAFSGGVDSAAAYELLNKPFPIYSKVDQPGGLHKQENALLALEEIDGISVLTNQDKIPLLYDKKRGFYGVAGWTVTSLLLSEHYGFDTFADGNILEFVYLRSKHGHGTLYNKPDYSEVLNAFKKLNYSYCLPCAGLTEVVTTQIAKDFKYAMGCMRGVGGKPCMACMKCYRKMAIQGNCISSNPEADKILNKEWIPVLASLLWARDQHGLSHPVLNDINKDYSWVDKWFSDSIEFIPESLRDEFLTNLSHYGIDHLMNNESVYAWSSRVND